MSKSNKRMIYLWDENKAFYDQLVKDKRASNFINTALKLAQAESGQLQNVEEALDPEPAHSRPMTIAEQLEAMQADQLARLKKNRGE